MQWGFLQEFVAIAYTLTLSVACVRENVVHLMGRCSCKVSQALAWIYTNWSVWGLTRNVHWAAIEDLGFQYKSNDLSNHIPTSRDLSRSKMEDYMHDNPRPHHAEPAPAQVQEVVTEALVPWHEKPDCFRGSTDLLNRFRECMPSVAE